MRWKVGASCIELSADSQAPVQGGGTGGNPPQPGRNWSNCWRQQFWGGSWRIAEINLDSWKRIPGEYRILSLLRTGFCSKPRVQLVLKTEIFVSYYCWAREGTVNTDKLVSCVNCADGRAEGPARRLKTTWDADSEVVLAQCGKMVESILGSCVLIPQLLQRRAMSDGLRGSYCHQKSCLVLATYFCRHAGLNLLIRAPLAILGIN